VFTFQGFDLNQCALSHLVFFIQSSILSMFHPDTYRSDPVSSGERFLPSRISCDNAQVAPSWTNWKHNSSASQATLQVSKFA
jgi:hypothetical protein